MELSRIDPATGKLNSNEEKDEKLTHSYLHKEHNAHCHMLE